MKTQELSLFPLLFLKASNCAKSEFRTLFTNTENPVKYIDPDVRCFLGERRENNTDILGITDEAKAAAVSFTLINVFRAKSIANERLLAATKMANRNSDVIRDDSGATDSNNTIGAFNNRADAYRHFTWNVIMTNTFGAIVAKATAAKVTADNHELFGEVGYGGNNSSKMDLWNNSIGRQLAQLKPNASSEELFAIAEKYNLLVTTTADNRLDLMEDEKNFKDGDVVLPLKVIESIQN